MSFHLYNCLPHFYIGKRKTPRKSMRLDDILDNDARGNPYDETNPIFQRRNVDVDEGDDEDDDDDDGGGDSDGDDSLDGDLLIGDDDDFEPCT